MTVIVDNNATPVDNGVAPVEPVAAPVTPAVTPSSWKETLRPDIKNSPLVQKFEDTPDGFNKAMESHLNLEKLLGNDKVPIPKDANDAEGWARFSKAMGIPDKPDGYGLQDASVPDSMKGLTFDKKQFAEVVHAQKLTPAQAKGLWDVYTKMNLDAYNKVMGEHQKEVNEMVNGLRSEWGDAYDSNVQLGQEVINKFAPDKETNDFLTALMTQDPRAVKFLSKLGNEFAENKIGDFSAKKFSKTPEEAHEEIQKIVKDPNHAYNSDKATQKEHQAAIDYVNSLYLAINRPKG
jgi:hypothetical protein